MAEGGAPELAAPESEAPVVRASRVAALGRSRWDQLVGALVASVALHALVVAPVVLLVAPSGAEAPPPPDVWAGATLDVALAELAGPEELAGAEPPGLAAAQPDAPPPAEPVAAPQPVALAAPPKAPEAPEAPTAEPASPSVAPAPLALPPPVAFPSPLEPSEPTRPRREHAKGPPDRSGRSGRTPRRRAERRAWRRDEEQREARRGERRDEARRAARGGRGGPPASAPSASGAPPGSSVGEAAGAAPDTPGAAGLPRGVRQLPTALTRVLPRVAVGDARFTEHAPGFLGEIKFTIAVSSAGAITEVTFAPDSDPLLQGLVERAVRFLGKGQFALRDSAEELGGVQQVILKVTLSQGAPDEDTDDPSATRSIGFDPPKPTSDGARRGVGYFELQGGLRLELATHFARD